MSKARDEYSYLITNAIEDDMSFNICKEYITELEHELDSRRKLISAEFMQDEKLYKRITELEQEKAELMEFIELLPEYEAKTILFYRKKLLSKHFQKIKLE